MFTGLMFNTKFKELNPSNDLALFLYIINLGKLKGTYNVFKITQVLVLKYIRTNLSNFKSRNVEKFYKSQ